MKTFLHVYQTQTELQAFLRAEAALASEHVLLQIFSGQVDPKRLESIGHSVLQTHPKISIIGATTCGEIACGQVLDHQIVLSFSVFEHTRIETFYYDDLRFETGQSLGDFALARQASCAILFADTLKGQPQDFLEGLTHQAPGLVIAGGNAGDNNQFQRTLLVEQNQVYDRGIVGCFLINPDLIVGQDHVLNWTSIGPDMTVTRCEQGVVYELDHQPVIDVYKRYLGDEVAQNLPSSIMEFPLMIEQDGMQIGRSAVGVTDDGGLAYAGVFHQGDQVRFGVADINTILLQSADKAKALVETQPIESVFIYSCTARRSFLKQHIEAEILALNKLAPSAGFFTYGEFYHNRQCNQLLNITTTFLTLSESKQIGQHAESFDLNRSIEQVSTLRSLTRLINVTTEDLNANVRFLDQYKNALDQTAIVSKTDPYGRITYANKQFETITGYRFDEVKGKNHNLLRHPDMPDMVFADLWQTIKDKKVWRGTIKNRKKDGSSYYVQSVIVPILDENQEIVEYISIRNDVTELLRKERELQQQRIDKLTGLPNRKQLLIDLETEHTKLIGLLDIKNFKAFNDFYGFDFADQILINFADWLKPLCYEMNLRLFSIQGDRFAIKPNIEMALADFQTHLISLKDQVSRHEFKVEHAPIDLDVSFGIGMGERYQMQLAETALNTAKALNLTHDIPVEQEGASEGLEHMFWLYKVKDALTEGRIVNYYQPIVNAHNPDEKKYEALVRLVTSTGEVVSPFKFLDVAKNSRYYNQITRQVFENALAFSEATQATVSVNLSIEDIENEELRLNILESLCGRQPGRLIFEITESESIRDYQVVHDFILSAKCLGAEIAIDDFGSGYSNFSYLVQMDADYLKIDGSIISQILNDQNSLLVAESIIDIAKKLGIKVVAEFVSDQRIANKLKAYGVDYFQGYHFGKPLPIEDIVQS